VRDLAFRDAAGRSTRALQRRFAHMEFEHVGALQTTPCCRKTVTAP
jgi:hypothetical protein